MRLDEATDLRIEGVRVKELRLNGVIIHRNYPYLYDGFSGVVVNTDKWDIIDPDATGDYSVSGGVFNIYNDDLENDGTGNAPIVGILSKRAFPVGATVEARVRNPQGRHALMIGMFASTPDSVYPHGGSVPGFGWYSRANTPDSVVGSYRDENGNTNFTTRASEDLSAFNTFKIERTDASTIKFYKNDVLVHTLSSVTFANEYKVCFVTDSWSDITELDVDWVEAIGPFDPTIT